MQLADSLKSWPLLGVSKYSSTKLQWMLHYARQVSSLVLSCFPVLIKCSHLKLYPQSAILYYILHCASLLVVHQKADLTSMFLNKSYKFQFRNGCRYPILQTLGLMWQLYAQVSVAGRSMNRLWHKMAATAVGSCIHVYRGSWGATGISVSLSKETGRGAALPKGDGPSTAEHLAVILTFFLLLTSTSPLSGDSLSPSLHLLTSPFPQHSSVSISVLGGICCSPQACLCLCWDDIHLVRREFHCSTSHHLHRACNFTRSCVPRHIKEWLTACVFGMKRQDGRECVAVSRSQEWLRELYLSRLFMFKGLMESMSVVPSGHSTTGFYLGLNG